VVLKLLQVGPEGGAQQAAGLAAGSAQRQPPEGVEELIRLFRIPLQPQTPDLFSTVCSKGLDTLISDASEPRVASRLPAWYRSAVQAPTFLLLPPMHKGAPLGLIYADKAGAGQLDLDDKQLALLRTLRNQAVMAFRQAG
jgi:hypothetical protein